MMSAWVFPTTTNNATTPCYYLASLLSDFQAHDQIAESRVTTLATLLETKYNNTAHLHHEETRPALPSARRKEIVPRRAPALQLPSRHHLLEEKSRRKFPSHLCSLSYELHSRVLRSKLGSNWGPTRTASKTSGQGWLWGQSIRRMSLGPHYGPP